VQRIKQEVRVKLHLQILQLRSRQTSFQLRGTQLPFAIAAMMWAGIRPLAALGAILRVVGSIAGTSIEVDSPKALVSIYVF